MHESYNGLHLMLYIFFKKDTKLDTIIHRSII